MDKEKFVETLCDFASEMKTEDERTLAMLFQFGALYLYSLGGKNDCSKNKDEEDSRNLY